MIESSATFGISSDCIFLLEIEQQKKEWLFCAFLLLKQSGNFKFKNLLAQASELLYKPVFDVIDFSVWKFLLEKIFFCLMYPCNFFVSNVEKNSNFL